MSEDTEGRRSFLGRLRRIGAGIVGVSAGLLPKKEGTIAPKEIPKDILSFEELSAAHIKINQTPDTSLFLRKSALEIPLIKDASSGKYSGVEITLIDAEEITWNSTEKISEDAKLVIRNVMINPEIRLKQEKERQLQEVQLAKKALEEKDQLIKDYNEKMSKIKDEIEAKTKVLGNLAASTERDKLWHEVSGLNGIYDEMRINLPKVNSQQREGLERAYLEQSRRFNKVDWDKKLSEFKEEGFSNALFIPVDNKYAPELVQRYSQLGNKVFIFIPVKGQSTPNPEESYPNPGYIKESTIDPNHPRIYKYDSFDASKYPGFILGHELSHYDHSTLEASSDEFKADIGAFEILQKAWIGFKKTGDNSGYPFVFVNKEGITITSSPNSQVAV